MTNLISRRSDGSLSGPAKWYTDFHVMTCPQCKAALKGLREVNEQVKELSSEEPGADLKLGDDAWKKIEAGWDAEENSTKSH
jgi:hypothetical protein